MLEVKNSDLMKKYIFLYKKVDYIVLKIHLQYSLPLNYLYKNNK